MTKTKRLLALIILLLFVLCASAGAATGYLLGEPRFKAFDNDGNPLSGGLLWTYKVGTTTAKDTYTNVALTVKNTNPIVLDSRGEATVYLSGATKLILTVAGGDPATPIWSFASAGSPLSQIDISIKDYGATGDGTTDDTAALNAATTACPAGGVLYVPPGTYKTTGWLITKDLSVVGDAPYLYGASTCATFKAAGAQAYIIKFQGAYGDGSGSSFVHPYIRNISINGDSQAISDAALVVEYGHLSHINRCSVMNVAGHGVRLRTCWEIKFTEPYFNNCGTVDTGSAFFIDGPTPYDASRATNSLRIIGGTWSGNKGYWIQATGLATLDACWIEGNKFEWDTGTANVVAADIIRLIAPSRTFIINNTFSGFGASSGNYANLIYLDGDAANNRGMPGAVIKGNRAYGYPTNGAINGLNLGADAPTVEEDDNWFIGSENLGCPNVNTSAYPQLIKRSWRVFSTSLYPLPTLPDRELPGFISIHQVQRGTYAKTFVADANCVSNAQTVLQLSAANQVNPDILSLFDLSRWVGSGATNLVLNMRMRLDAAGSVTVRGNPSNPGSNTVDATVNTTSWAWYSFSFPIATITQVNHLLDVYLWSIDAGTPKLLVDGMEFSTN